jgi:hypothetical protein
MRGSLRVDEEAGVMRIGTQLLSALASREEQANGSPGFSGADGTLLAVVPIPGTGTSLAIVGYPVSNETGAWPGASDIAAVSGGSPGDSPAPTSVGTVSVGTVSADSAPASAGLLLDHDQRRVWADGQEVPLTYQEFELLAFLCAHPATVFSRPALVAQVWHRDFAADSRTVDVHVSRLRQKLGPRYGRYLVTEYRVGYQFRPVVT